MNLNSFPKSPGVYLMKDDKGEILYIGKAKNLQNRVKQYFENSGDSRPMVPFLVKRVNDIDVIVVSSEREALLLENNLIKLHKPKYNVLLKDDKGYIHIKMTKEKWPRICIDHDKKKSSDGIYFGPYTSKKAAKQTVKLLQRLFPLRQCKKFGKKPCLLYQMGFCLGPCGGKCTEGEYAKHVKMVVQFLKGKNKALLKDLYQEMEFASKKLEFEKAGALLKTIRYIEDCTEAQKVDLISEKDVDVISIFGEGKNYVVAQLFWRGGKLIGINKEKIESLQSRENIIRSFVLQRYGVKEKACEILIPCEIEDRNLIENAFKIKIAVPKRGKNLALVKMAEKNAQEELLSLKRDENILQNLQEKLSLSKYPKRIECFDNSNFSGESLVSAMVVFENGKKSTKNYRKYKIRGAVQDDYAAIREVLERRYSPEKKGELPDLIIVDGGKGHLNCAMAVLDERNISVDLIAISKENSRHDKGLSCEKIFYKGEMITLERDSKELFLLQNIRDEAHRFVINFLRQSIRKNRVR